MNDLFRLDAVGHEQTANDGPPQSVRGDFRHGMLDHHVVHDISDGNRRHFDPTVAANRAEHLVANIVLVPVLSEFVVRGVRLLLLLLFSF